MDRWFNIISTLLLISAKGLSQTNDSSLVVLWDTIYEASQPEFLNDISLLPSGKLLAVGATRNPNADLDGLFVLIGAEGNVIIRKSLGSTLRDDVLLSGVEAEDGTFYLVGQSFAGPELGNQAWIVRLDDKGREMPMSQHYFGGKGDDKFAKIVWTDSNTGLVTFTGDTLPEGNIALFQIKGSNIEQSAVTGEFVAEDLVVMEKNPKGGVWLGGNARRSDITRRGDVWVSLLNDNGTPRFTNKISDRYRKRLFTGAATQEGNLWLAGEGFASSNGDSDAWIAEFAQELRTQRKPEYFGDDASDFANLLLATPRGEKWVLMNDRNTRSFSIRCYRGAGKTDRVMYDVFKQSRFDPVKMLQLASNTYLLAGTGFDAVQNTEALRIICFEDKETAQGRGSPKASIHDITFAGNNGSKSLGTGEYGSVRFRVKNEGDAPLEEGIIRAELVSPFQGLAVIRQYQIVPYLSAKGEKVCAISIFGGKNLASGQAKLRITLEGKGLEKKIYPFDIPCRLKQPEPDTAAIFTYISPNRVANREFEAAEKNYPVEIKAITKNSRVQAADFKVYKNRTVLSDQKAPSKLEGAQKSNNRYEYNFEAQIPLDEGRNVIYFELAGDISDSIVVHFNPQLPNLHVLAIGIPAADLKYTQKDARDFAAAVSEQASRGFFGRVNVQLLTSPDSTTRDAIGIAFETMLDAALAQQIKPNDYLMVFISSHGKKGKNGRFYLQSSGCNPQYEATMMDYQDIITKYLNPVNCKKILFVDACHSGADSTREGSKAPSQRDLAQALFAANAIAQGTVAVASCSENESSYEHSAWQNGAFTQALLDAFQGETVTGTDGKPCRVDTGSWLEIENQYTPKPDSIVTLDELKAFLQTRVPRLVQDAQDKIGSNASQQPVVSAEPSKNKLTIFILK